jgi:hypothetical protein
MAFLRANGAIGPPTADLVALALTRANASAPRMLVDPSGTGLVDAWWALQATALRAGRQLQAI